jgi:hypothetical protein
MAFEVSVTHPKGLPLPRLYNGFFSLIAYRSTLSAEAQYQKVYQNEIRHVCKDKPSSSFGLLGWWQMMWLRWMVWFLKCAGFMRLKGEYRRWRR